MFPLSVNYRRILSGYIHLWYLSLNSLKLCCIMPFTEKQELWCQLVGTGGMLDCHHGNRESLWCHLCRLWWQHALSQWQPTVPPGHISSCIPQFYLRCNWIPFHTIPSFQRKRPIWHRGESCFQCQIIVVKHILPADSVIWASYQIRHIAGCACAGNAGNVFSATDCKRNR